MYIQFIFAFLVSVYPAGVQAWITSVSFGAKSPVPNLPYRRPLTNISFPFFLLFLLPSTPAQFLEATSEIPSGDLSKYLAHTKTNEASAFVIRALKILRLLCPV